MTVPPPGRPRLAPGYPHPDDDPEERDPSLARERTSLAWTRTAISFAALGGTMLKANVVTGLIILAVTPVIWQLGRVSRGRLPAASPPAAPAAPALSLDPAAPALPAVGAVRLFLITVAVVVVSLLCLIVAIFGPSVPGALR